MNNIVTRKKTYFDVWKVFKRFVQEVGENASDNRLVGNQQNIALSLQLHHNRFQPSNQVLTDATVERHFITRQSDSHYLITFSTGISVDQLVVVSRCEFLRKSFRDLFVRQALHNSSI